MNSSANPTKAEQHLRSALQALQRYADTESRREADDTLKAAAKHIAQARELDPKVQASTNGSGLHSVDSVSALALYCEATHRLAIKEISKRELSECASILERSVQYAPRAHTYLALAKCKARQFQRNEAISAAKKALEYDPDYQPARQALDKLEAHPQIGERPNILKRHPTAFVSLGTLAAIIGAGMWLFGKPFGGLIFVAGCAAGVLGHFADRGTMFADALEELEGYSTRTL
jgi:tetratricopeptide (TPR) repeat protein